MAWNRPPEYHVSPRAKLQAESLRRAMTEPERKLWAALRRRLSVSGTHFRRQTPIGPYVADFCCYASRLIVEVDGWQHGLEGQKRHDEVRTRYLEAQGFRVIRFWNHEIIQEIDVVVDTILARIHEQAPL
ncbi:MAG TPA: DUF559 domain-containing protein [Beijerinckiaceae bacterium]|nr:DUF559 domain-containing protein [Beijerinckiaceae bacterium]